MVIKVKMIKDLISKILPVDIILKIGYSCRYYRINDKFIRLGIVYELSFLKIE